MTDGLSDPLLSQLSKSIADQAGLSFPPERWRDLERGIQSAAHKFGCSDAESCARHLLSAPLTRKEIEILARELTVGETYFFREKQSFEILSERVLPALACLRRGTERRLRIWSAGCCTGEEPYSIAIWLDRFLPDLREWQVTILGTDINPLFLRKASEGVFSEWSFRDSPPWLKSNYFKPAGAKHFEIAPRIKERVTFAYLNLAEDVYPSLDTNTNAMELIFCRNVLMYFTPQGAKKVIRNFHRSMINQGWLIVSPTEVSSELFSPFSPVQFQRATLYQKGERSSSALAFSFPLEISSPLGEAPALSWQPPVSIVAPSSLSVSLPEPSMALPVVDIKSTLYEEALVLFEQGNYAEAAEKLKTDATSSPLAPENAALLARICANLGELTEALSWAQLALSADKLNAGWHYLRAVILQEQGNVEESAVALKRTLYLDPNFVLAHFALGNLALRKNHIKEADRHFANVLGLMVDYQPDDVLPQSDGLVMGRLREMVESTMAMERTA